MAKNKKKSDKDWGVIFSDPVKVKKFLKNIEQQHQYQDLINKMHYVFSAYNQELQSYLNNYWKQMIEEHAQKTNSQEILGECKFKYDMMLDFFSSTERFFFDNQKNICRTNPSGKFFCFNENNYFEVFKENSLIPPTPIVIKWLYAILTLRKESGDWGTYFKFKQRTNDQPSIYDDLGFFHLFDGNLAVLQNSAINIIHEKNYGEPVKTFKQIKPTLKEFQAISRILKGTLKENEEKNLSCEKRAKKIFMNEIIGYLQKNNEKSALKINVNDISDKPHFVINSSGKSVTIRKVLNEASDKIPPNVSKYIAALTGGNIDTIDQLAKMIALINLEKKINPKMFGVIIDNKHIFIKFIMYFYIGDEIDYVFAENLKKTKYIVSAIELNYLSLMLTLIMLKPSSKSTLELDEKYFVRLKKMILSKPIKDKSFGEINYINRSVCIALIQNEMELKKYLEYIGDKIEIINLDNIVKEELKEIKIDDDDYWWIHIIFATYGLMLLLKRQKKKEIYDSQRIVKQFIECCCIVSPKIDCYKEDFYQDFVRFFKAQFNINPIKKVHLENIIKMYCEITDTRPRHEANENRRGLKGIAVDKDKLNEYLANIEENKQRFDMQRGIEYLNIINKMVINLLNGNRNNIDSSKSV